MNAEVVAKRLVDGIRNGEFFINFDFLGDLLGYLTSGFAPLPGILNNMLCVRPQAGVCYGNDSHGYVCHAFPHLIHDPVCAACSVADWSYHCYGAFVAMGWYLQEVRSPEEEDAVKC